MQNVPFRINCFDFLRFLFAFMVVLRHLVYVSEIPELKESASFLNTYLSVPGFFIISGFLILQSYKRTTSLRTFFLKRIRRLLPIYFLVVLLCAFGLVFMSDLSAIKYFTHPQLFKYLIANLSTLNFIQPCLPGVFENFEHCGVNSSLWTIKVEVMFYLSIPIIVWAYNKTKYKIPFLAILYILSVLYQNSLLICAENSNNTIYNILARQFPGYLSYFISGIACNYYFNKIISYKKLIVIPALLVFITEAIIGIEILTPFAMAILILYIAYSIPILNNFSRYGDISYGIFVFHFPIFKIMVSLGIYDIMPVWAAFFCMIICVVVVGFLSWHFIEKPILNRNPKKIT